MLPQRLELFSTWKWFYIMRNIEEKWHHLENWWCMWKFLFLEQFFIWTFFWKLGWVFNWKDRNWALGPNNIDAVWFLSGSKICLFVILFSDLCQGPKKTDDNECRLWLYGPVEPFRLSVEVGVGERRANSSRHHVTQLHTSRSRVRQTKQVEQ